MYKVQHADVTIFWSISINFKAIRCITIYSKKSRAKHESSLCYHWPQPSDSDSIIMLNMKSIHTTLVIVITCAKTSYKMIFITWGYLIITTISTFNHTQWYLRRICQFFKLNLLLFKPTRSSVNTVFKSVSAVRFGKNW